VVPSNQHSNVGSSILATFLWASLALFSIGAGWASQATAAGSAQEKLDRAEEKIARGQDREEVLTSEIDTFSDEISALKVEVDALRTEETAAEDELVAKQQELDSAIEKLEAAIKQLKVQRQHLKRALKSLRTNLIATYMSGPTDMAELALASSSYGELVASNAYIEAIQNQGELLAGRVRELRDQAQSSVKAKREAKSSIEAARDEIAARELQLETTRTTLESRQSSLVTAQDGKQQLLETVRSDVEQQEEIAADLRAKIADAVAAASSSSTSTSSVSGNGSMIWPIDGILTSPFGYRWGRAHEGLDIAGPAGTPIQAAASGTVMLMQSEAESGGYGNFTCVDHGGGLSTCYAHQSEFGTSVGAKVSQGDVIGYVGNTGNSFGDHVHFEVRIDGVAQDPMGYL